MVREEDKQTTYLVSDVKSVCAWPAAPSGQMRQMPRIPTLICEDSLLIQWVICWTVYNWDGEIISLSWQGSSESHLDYYIVSDINMLMYQRWHLQACGNCH